MGSLAISELSPAGEGCFVFDETGSLRHANTTACLLLDYPKEELLSLSVQQIKEGGASALEVCRQMSPGEEQTAECVLYRRDGSELLAETQVQSFMVRNLRLFFATTRPVNSPGESDESHRWNQLGRMSAGIVHDFNNMLTSVLGNAELGLLKLQPGSKGFHELELIQRAGFRLRDLCASILAFSRARKAEKRIRTTVDMVCRDTIELIEIALPSNVVLRLDLQQTHEVEIEFLEIQQVLVNAIVNAVDAIGPKGGAIHLRAGDKVCSADFLDSFHLSRPASAGEYAVFEVIDNGPGIEAGVLAHLFRSQFTTKRTGHGLGMAVVADIMMRHNGFVGISTGETEGTRFSVFLPFAG